MKTIQEIPVSHRVYYKSFIDAYTQKKEEAKKVLEELESKRDNLYKQVKNEFELKGDSYGINLNLYKEFTRNEYIAGELFRVAKGFYTNKNGDYEIIGSRFDLFNLAKTQKEIYELKETIKLYDKLTSLKLNEYTSILKTYFNKVHEKMILEGCGYSLGGNVGWICINRCRLQNPRKLISYKETNERKKQLLKEGKRLYNAEEAKWCKANGIEYDGVDYRVFIKCDYVYEIPLIGCKLVNGSKLKLTVANYVGRSIRGKTQEQLLQECNYDKEKICKLDTDIKTKLTLCLQIDKILYSKFIRNENQQPNKFRQISRES